MGFFLGSLSHMEKKVYEQSLQLQPCIPWWIKDAMYNYTIKTQVSNMYITQNHTTLHHHG